MNPNAYLPRASLHRGCCLQTSREPYEKTDPRGTWLDPTWGTEFCLSWYGTYPEAIQKRQSCRDRDVPRRLPARSDWGNQGCQPWRREEMVWKLTLWSSRGAWTRMKGRVQLKVKKTFPVMRVDPQQKGWVMGKQILLVMNYNDEEGWHCGLKEKESTPSRSLAI